MENELRKEGARPPAYRERPQVVGREDWGFSRRRDLCCVVRLKEFTSCKCQTASRQVKVLYGQLRPRESQEAGLSHSPQLLWRMASPNRTSASPSINRVGSNISLQVHTEVSGRSCDMKCYSRHRGFRWPALHPHEAPPPRDISQSRGKIQNKISGSPCHPRTPPCYTVQSKENWGKENN